MYAPDQIAAMTMPALLGAMAAEYGLSVARGRPAYSHRQTFNNVAVAVGSRAMLATTGLVPLLGYEPLRAVSPFRALWSAAAWWQWIVAFLIVDLAFYVRHYAAHRVALLWTVHAVHHQSREYNLSVATRLGWFQDAIVIGFPLALAGMPYEIAFPLWLFGNSYQVFCHTEQVGRLGVLDRILLTPSNHRVHHGCNPKYLDCNYGNFLLVWDRLFGTWVPETEPVRYGVLSGLRTYDASENNLEPLRLLWRKVARFSSWWDKLRVVLAPPAWVPGQGEVEPVMVDEPEPQRSRAVSMSARVTATTLLGMAMGLAAIVSWYAAVWDVAWRVPWFLATVLVLAIGGVVLDAQPVEPVPMPTAVGRAQARVAAAILTLAGPDAEGLLKKLGRWLTPRRPG